MNSSSISFIAWSGFMLLMLLGLLIASRRGRSRTQKTEDIASRVLPEIGNVAERTHKRRFGSPLPLDASPYPTPATPGREQHLSWYPPTKPQRAIKQG